MNNLKMFKNSRKTELKSGDTITFGRYYYDSNIIKPIEWIVLKEYKDRILVFSKYAIDVMGYITDWDYNDIEKSHKKLIWEFSDLKKWLNEDFYQTAFNEREKKRILVTTIITTEIEGNSDNKVFILSEEQIEQLLNQDTLCASPTPYALAQNAVVEHGTDCSPYWILPSINKSAGYCLEIEDEYLSHLEIYPKAITGSGKIYCHSRNVYHKDFTIRPALYIEKAFIAN